MPPKPKVEEKFWGKKLNFSEVNPKKKKVLWSSAHQSSLLSLANLKPKTVFWVAPGQYLAASLQRGGDKGELEWRKNRVWTWMWTVCRGLRQVETVSLLNYQSTTHLESKLLKKILACWVSFVCSLNTYQKTIALCFRPKCWDLDVLITENL